MKVGIDLSKMHSFSSNRGIGFYTNYLIDALKDNSEIELEVIKDGKQIPRIDLIHYPFFDFFRSTLPIIKKYPTIVTIHDVIPLVFPKEYPPGIKGRINFQKQKIALKSVKAIITDSISSKKDLIKYLKLNPKLIYPIHLAPSLNYKKIEKSKIEAAVKKYSPPKKFALFVGNVNWNKNLVNLTKACIDSNLDLVLVGSGFENRANLNHPELKSFKIFLDKFSNNKKIHVLNFVSADELSTLYTLASVLLLPSFYEGFGLPILEAQTYGVPVITSKTSSMPEVVGDGGVLVDPYDTSSIQKAIYDILNIKALRNKLIKKGYENVKKYSWDKVALETIKVYRQVI